MTPADLGTRVQILAAVFSAQNQVIEALPSLFNSRMGLDFKSLFKDLETRLQDSFKFTAEQNVLYISLKKCFETDLVSLQLNIRRVAQEMICQPTRTAFKKMHVDIEVCGYRLCVTDLCECSLHFYFKGQNASKSRQTPARKHYWNPFSRDSLHSQGQGNLISSSKYFPIGCKFF